MATGREILKMVGFAGLVLLIGQGCSQKSVRTTADSETFERGSQFADNHNGADNPFGQQWQPFGSWEGGANQGQPNGSSSGEWQYGAGQPSNEANGAQSVEPQAPAQAYIHGVPQGDAGAQQGEYGNQYSKQPNGLSYFGTREGSDANQSGSQPWSNGPLAGLQEYEGGSGGDWSSGQGYHDGQSGSMAEEFIQEDYDNIAQVQPFSAPGNSQGWRYGKNHDAQGGQGGQFSRVRVELQDVFFEFDSWRINQDGRQALAHDAEWLGQNHNRKLTVEGHCDQRGSRNYNLALGKKRAEAVRTYLVDLGVQAHKIQVISYGKERPFCFGNNEQCYQLNRRGHLQLHH